jgi:tetratricopeptide (TPR) repeat protein
MITTFLLDRRSSSRICLFLVIAISFFFKLLSAKAQDDLSIDLNNIEIPEARLPLCFGLSDISELPALEICDALNLDLNVKARELSEQWVRTKPDSPAAQFALAEVLLTVEGNMPRALFHLNRAEELTGYETLEKAVNSGHMPWHYLTLSQLSFVHQLMGEQIKSLVYLDKLNEIYGLDIESLRGWPLIKLKQYEAARQSANRVLQTNDNERERARAWNTLCAAELASLLPIKSTSACDRTIDGDENNSSRTNNFDTVYLTNASEVALSLLEIEQAEDYLRRATQYLNPNSVADPWIYMLYLSMNQGRFDEARNALDSMLLWREQQEPIVSIMNRAEHFLVSASFLLLAGYAEDAVKLTKTALNQPDRNGSYSADDEQKDAYAALLNMAANRAEYQIQLENMATMDFIGAMRVRLNSITLQLNAWRAARRAGSLFAKFEVIQNRLRPYAPLDVHIPEWLEPELVQLIGTGVMSAILEQARENGAFQLNNGYYYSYRAEIAALDKDYTSVLEAAGNALTLLPEQETLLRARISARMADAFWKIGQHEESLNSYAIALRQDPSISRRLEASIPVRLDTNGSEFSKQVSKYLLRSPRFQEHENGFNLSVRETPDLSICLNARTGNVISCYAMSTAANQSSDWNAQELTRNFHVRTFGLGYDISKAQRSTLLGSSVILSSLINGNQNREDFLKR